MAAIFSPFENFLKIVFYHNNEKSYRQISSIIGCSKSAALDVCKKFEKTRSVKNLPSSGRPRTPTTPTAEHSVITEQRQNRFASLRKIATNVLFVALNILLKFKAVFSREENISNSLGKFDLVRISRDIG